jgi:beta-glucosidase-like glycosyl hydrolase
MEENFAEDPYMVSRYGVAAVSGLQGHDGLGGASEYLGSPREHVASQAKQCVTHHPVTHLYCD